MRTDDDAISDSERWVDIGWWSKRLKVSKRSIERYVSVGDIPQPIRLGGRLQRWRLTSALAHLERMEKAAAAGV
jgi:predicted DNA-binding transcriptional regulator AlpA